MAEAKTGPQTSSQAKGQPAEVAAPGQLQAAEEAKLDGPMEEGPQAPKEARQELAPHPQLPAATDSGRHSSSSDHEIPSRTVEYPPTT